MLAAALFFWPQPKGSHSGPGWPGQSSEGAAGSGIRTETSDPVPWGLWYCVIRSPSQEDRERGLHEQTRGKDTLWKESLFCRWWVSQCDWECEGSRGKEGYNLLIWPVNQVMKVAVSLLHAIWEIWHLKKECHTAGSSCWAETWNNMKLDILL